MCKNNRLANEENLNVIYAIQALNYLLNNKRNMVKYL